LTIIDDIFEAEYNSQRHKKYYVQNREKELEQHKIIYQDVKNTLKQIIGDKCTWCGSLEFDFLELDHINSDGSQKRRLFNGHKTEWRYYIRHPDEAKEVFQLLRPTCHRKKKHLAGEVPYGSKPASH
jgi:hypothetical protein